MVTLHRTVGWILIIGNGLAGAWVLAANWLPRLRVRPMWWFVIAVQVVVAIQVVLGVILWNTTDARPPGNRTSQMTPQARQKYKNARKISIGFSGLFLIGISFPILGVTRCALQMKINPAPDVPT